MSNPRNRAQRVRTYLQCILTLVLAASAMLLAPATARAQAARQSLTGTVVDASGAAVVGATVVLEGTSLQTVTDAAGRFTFSGLTGRTHRIRVERLGYETKRMTHSLDTGGALTVALVSRPVDLGGVMVIGSSREQEKIRAEIKGNPGSVDIIEPQELRATRQANLPDILRFTPGVFAQARFGAADESQLSIRGSGLRNNFHMRGVNLLINGMPYRNADGFTDFESLELMTAHSVHVYKAASAFRYGGSTLGGAIDIQTKTGYTAEPINVNMEGGAFGFFKGQASSGASNGPFDYYASYTRTQLDGNRAWSDQKRDRLNLHAGYVISPKLDARAFYVYADIKEHLPGSLTAAEYAATPEIAVANNMTNRHGRDFKLHHFGTQVRAQLSPSQSFEVAPYVQYRDIVHPIFRVIDQISRDVGVDSRYENEANIGSHQNRLAAGVQWAFGNTDNRTFDNVKGEEGTLRKDQLDEAGSLAAYVEDRFNATSRFSTVVGIRWSSNLRRATDSFLSDGDQSDEKHFDAFTPRFGVLYDLPSVNGQIYANAARTWEPPLLLELNSATIPGFVDLKAQDARQYEIGTRGKSRGVTWDVAVYSISVRNEVLNMNVQPFPGAPFTVPTYRNAERTSHRGIEAAIQHQIASNLLSSSNGGDALTGQVSYTYSRFRFEKDATYTGNKLPGAPEHTLDAELAYRHPSGFSLRPSMQWAGGDYFVNSANTVSNDGWVTFGARAEMLVQRFDARLFIEGRNLGDKIYSGAVSVDDGNNRSFLPADRRAVYAGVQWQH